VALQRLFFPLPARTRQEVLLFLWKRAARKVMMLLPRSFLHRPDIYLASQDTQSETLP
jgi:hypothetical protein